MRDEIIRPQLNALGRVALMRWLEKDPSLPPGTRKDYGLGGLLVLHDLEGWQGKKTMSWGGTPDLSWVSEHAWVVVVVVVGQAGC